MSTKTNNLKMTLPTGTENITRSVINGNFEIVDAAVGSVQDGLAIVSDGDTHGAIANGQFVYVRNHNTLAEGLYKARAAIGANVALTTSNLTANGSGGLNDLQSQVNTLSSQLVSDLGSKSLSDLETALVTLGNSLGTGGVAHFTVAISTTSAPFSAASYIGFVEKITNNRLTAILSRNVVNQTLCGRYNGSWAWAEFATRLYAQESPSSYSSDLSAISAIRRGDVVQVNAEIKAGLSAGWHNTISTGLSTNFRPLAPVYGSRRVSASSDLAKPTIAILNTDGTIQFLNNDVMNAVVTYSFTFVSAN